MPSIRTFIAIPTQPTIQQSMVSIQSDLKETHADVKWDSPDKFHITLKFLGDVEISRIEPLSSALMQPLQRFQWFDITYNALGVFPHLRSPRVVWIGTEQNVSILNLQSEIENICLDFGFPKEERPFHPHITLGRVKGTHHLMRLTDAIKTITFEPMQSHCSDVLLMKSELRPGGSLYTIMKSFSLHS